MRRQVLLLSLVLAVLVSMSFYASASDDIKVYLNNRLIPFDQPPVMIDGNILVPMRGVFEELGADVKWKSSSQTIYAKRDTTEIIIQIGAPFASVNGKTTELAAPAAMVRGRTMVPLRFVSEALGAEVKWHGATRTVIITSTGTPAPSASSTPAPVQSPAPSAAVSAPKITAVSHSASAPLKPGDTLTVTVHGDTGCICSIDIYGVVANSPLREISPGVYSGSITIPAGTGNIENASVFGRLNKVGRESMLASGKGVKITSMLMKVSKVLPKPKDSIRTNRPNILIVLESMGNARIVTSSVSLVVNSLNVTSQATLSDDMISYVPSADLPDGTTTISLSAKDTGGNDIHYSWNFQVQTRGSITSVTHNATSPLPVGSTLQVVLQGDPGGAANFDIGNYYTTIPMTERTPGHYVGVHGIQARDTFQNAPVTGRLTMPGKSPITLNATTTVSAQRQITLKITSPSANSTVDSQFPITGSTSPFAKVQINVQVMFSGVFSAPNDLVTTEVQANDAGNFQYTVKDWLPFRGGSYIITAVAKDSSNRLSEKLVINVNRK
ncbi:MAG: stalk domain-containing protein [Candidatus Xenobiia bacterium LiM19]